MLTTFFRKNSVQLQRYALSGTFVFLLGHLEYRLLYTVLRGVPMRAGTAWGLHFIIATVWSHRLHRSFTFREQQQVPYLESLLRTFGSYAVVLALSTVIMFLFCDMAGYSPLIGWILATGVCAVCNFLIMTRWTICRNTKDHTARKSNYEGRDKKIPPYADSHLGQNAAKVTFFKDTE